MGLVTERLYDPSKPLFLAKDVRFDGRDCQKGDEAPIKDMSKRTLMKYFRTGLFVHEVRKHKQEPVVEETEQKDEEVAPKRRGRKASKS
jgi:hypothetical protein